MKEIILLLIKIVAGAVALALVAFIFGASFALVMKASIAGVEFVDGLF